MATTTTRETDTYARVINDNLNAWTDFADASDINIDVAYQFVDSVPQESDQNYWAYRGQAAMCVKGDETEIVRVRIGDGTSTDWKVYIQHITDPEDATQWETWAVLYTGTHYAVAIEETASSYHVYTAKVDGIYVDNVLKLAVTGVIRLKPTAFELGRLYFQTVEQDTDTYRTVKWWYTDILAGSPTIYEDCANYRWYRTDMVAMGSDRVSGGIDLYRFRAMAHERGARERYASETLTVDWTLEATAYDTAANKWQQVRYIAGPSEQAGFKVYDNLYVANLASSRWPGGAYFLFYNERHFDVSGNVLSNFKNPLFWQRSIGYPYYLSAPMPVGYSIWGFAGAVQWENYIWVAGNGRVLRRPQLETMIDLSDYTVEGGYDIPRSNQKSTGLITWANPDNVVGSLLGLTDADEAGFTERRIDLALGQRGADDTAFTYKVDDAWRITQLRKTRDDGYKDHVVAEIGNFWHRMEIPYRDALYLPGHLLWNDWQPEAANQPFNYSNAHHSFSSYNPAGADASYVPRLKTATGETPDTPVPSGVQTITRFAGWRGENGWVRALLWESGGFVFRWQDNDNFFFVEATEGGNIVLKQYSGGTLSGALASAAMTATAPFWLTVDFRWKKIRIDVDFDDIVIEHTLVDPAILSGWVGVTSPEISNLEIMDWNASMTTKELLRIGLAYIDEHEVELELDEDTAAAEQVDLQLGPQASDLDTPEKLFRQVIEASNLQVVFLED